ncbi:hypothetical protein HPP92_015503 [Vanilla planifolia]|uniref:Uncharacterized protein n=1 Tax=Vanilla planifolia TaxID=51239 RepID=A0A835QI13_VANPL|nr:hypothetical protein HPP92_015503 [Vanilla planifolia]
MEASSRDNKALDALVIMDLPKKAKKSAHAVRKHGMFTFRYRTLNVLTDGGLNWAILPLKSGRVDRTGFLRINSAACQREFAAVVSALEFEATAGETCKPSFCFRCVSEIISKEYCLPAI